MQTNPIYLFGKSPSSLIRLARPFRKSVLFNSSINRQSRQSVSLNIRFGFPAQQTINILPQKKPDQLLQQGKRDTRERGRNQCFNQSALKLYIHASPNLCEGERSCLIETVSGSLQLSLLLLQLPEGGKHTGTERRFEMASFPFPCPPTVE